MEGALERLLVRGDWLISGPVDDVIHDGAILTEEGRVVSVGPYAAVRRAHPKATVRPGRGLVILPGLIDSHSHGRGLSLSRRGIDPSSLELFFLQIGALTRVDVEDDAFLAGADLLGTGVTAAQVFFHSLAGLDVYQRDAVATLGGLRRAGIRTTLIVGVTEQEELFPELALTDLPTEIAPDLVRLDHAMGTAEFVEAFWLLQTAHSNPQTRFGLGPGAPQWCSEATLAKVGELMRTGIRAQTHLLETRIQRSSAYGASPVAKLARAGMLSPALSAAHGVWLSDAELALLARRGTVLVHCPSSNAHLGSGTARVRSWLDAGIEVSLGLDSNTADDPPDAFNELRRVRAAASAVGTEITPREALAMATTGGAGALGMSGELGVLRAGAHADFVTLELPELPCGVEDEVAYVLDHARRTSIRSVWAGGCEVVSDGFHVAASHVASARARLLGEIERDAVKRRTRLGRIAAVEPWAIEVWARLADQAESEERLSSA